MRVQFSPAAPIYNASEIYLDHKGINSNPNNGIIGSNPIAGTKF